MVVSLIGSLDSPFVQRALLVAAYAGIQLKLVSITTGKENETEEYRLNCHPMQRVPVLKTDEGYLFETNAIIRYLARTEVMLVAVNTGLDGGVNNEKTPHPQYPVPYAMYGHSLLESTAVDSWLDFAITHIDYYTKQFYLWEKKAGPKPAPGVKEKFWRALEGLEHRLAYLKETRRVLVQQSGSLTARTAMTDEDFLWNDEEYMTSRATRDSRLSSVYNVAGSIRHRTSEKERQEREKTLENIKKTTDEALGVSEEDNRNSWRMSSARDSAMTPRMSAITPRASVLMSTRGSIVAGGAGLHVVQRQDLLFLVGDSLTAADLVLAMALHSALSLPELKSDIIAKFPNTFKYYKNVLTLPVAVEVGKAIRLNVIKA
jgi:glutathione S-transferase